MRVIRYEVVDSTGLARSTVYKYISEDGFPCPVPSGDRCVGWLESEVQEWILEKVTGRNIQLYRLWPKRKW